GGGAGDRRAVPEASGPHAGRGPSAGPPGRGKDPAHGARELAVPAVVSRAPALVAEGELGDILLPPPAPISAGFLPGADGRRPALERQPFMAREARLMIAEVLIHQLDVVRYLCGPLRVVGARALKTLPEVRGESLATIFLETATGAPVEVTGTMAAPG